MPSNFTSALKVRAIPNKVGENIPEYHHIMREILFEEPQGDEFDFVLTIQTTRNIQ